MMRRANELVAAPRNDAYVGMLVISLAMLVVGAGLLFVDYSRYSSKHPSDVPPPTTIKNAR
jgi:hypothetical protein